MTTGPGWARGVQVAAGSGASESLQEHRDASVARYSASDYSARLQAQGHASGPTDSESFESNLRVFPGRLPVFWVIIQDRHDTCAEPDAGP